MKCAYDFYLNKIKLNFCLFLDVSYALSHTIIYTCTHRLTHSYRQKRDTFYLCLSAILSKLLKIIIKLCTFWFFYRFTECFHIHIG